MNNSLQAFLLTVAFVILQDLNAITVYADRVDWENAVQSGSVFNEDFNEPNFGVITDGEIVEYENGLSLIGDGSGGLVIYRTSNGIFNTGHLDTDFESTNTRLIFQFESPILGFGFDYSNAEETGALLILDFGFGDIEVAANDDLLSAAFFGVLFDQPLTSFTITTGTGDQDVDIDNLVFTVVPLPPAILMFSTGIFVLTLLRRRSSKSIAPN